ncbi:MAG TPA: glycosyltransferase family 39 protein [Pirellulales bacterium]
MRSKAQQAAENQGRKLALLLAAAAVLRAGTALFALALAQPAPQFREPDSDGYLRLAANWWQTGRYAMGAEPEILRSPGYPLLLLPEVALGRADWLTIALQIALSCVTVWLVYRTGLALFNHAATALGAAALFACDPLSVLYASKLLSETAFTTAISAAVYLLIRYLLSPHWRHLLAAAVCVAAAAYLRPIAYYLPIWIGVSLVCIQWRRSDRWRLLLYCPRAGTRQSVAAEDGPPGPSPTGVTAWEGHPTRARENASFLLVCGVEALAFTVLGMSLLAAWQFRNWKETGYTGFSAISDKNLYYYEALPVLAERRGVPPARRQQARYEAGETDLAIYLRRHPEQANWTAPARYRFLRHEALRIIRAQPLAWAKIHFTGVWHTLTDSGRNAWLSFFGLADMRATDMPRPPRTFWQRLCEAATERPAVLAIHALLAAFVAVYLVLALFGIIRAARLPCALLVLSVALYLVLLSGGDAGYHRFRLPVTPAICLFAAHGFASFSARLAAVRWLPRPLRRIMVS